MTITRIAGVYQGRSRAVMHNGIVYAVATDQTSAEGISEQTRRTLTALEINLKDAGSDKSRLLQATVYLTDMSFKAQMDTIWCAWIGEQENWPQRACVGAALAEGTLIEIAVTAAVI